MRILKICLPMILFCLLIGCGKTTKSEQSAAASSGIASSATSSKMQNTQDVNIQEIKEFILNTEKLIDLSAKKERLCWILPGYEVFELTAYDSYYDLVEQLKPYFSKPALFYFIQLNSIYCIDGKAAICYAQEIYWFRHKVDPERGFSISGVNGKEIVVNVPFKSAGVGDDPVELTHGTYTLEKQDNGSYKITDMEEEFNLQILPKDQKPTFDHMNPDGIAHAFAEIITYE